MASSMKLEFPLNGALPSTEHARDRLLAKIFRFRRENQTFKDKAFVLLYAYSKTATYPTTNVHILTRTNYDSSGHGTDLK